MPAKRIDFTIRVIEALPPSSKDRDEYMDAKTPGLYLRVTKNGVKSFSCVGRAKGASKPERVTLGRFPAVKPEEARKRALKLAGEMAGGTSPAAAQRALRGEMTLNELAERFRTTYKSPRSLETFDTLFRLEIAPAFGKRRLSEVKPQEVGKWHKGLPAVILQRRADIQAEQKARREAKRKEIEARQAVRRHGPAPKVREELPSTSTVSITGETTANRALRALRSMYNWATKPAQGLFSGLNPAVGHAQFRERSRDRFLQPKELEPFFAALAEEQNEDARDGILLKLLTGGRRTNVHAMKWAELHLEDAEWHIPRTKNGEPQVVPLVPEAVDLLTARRQKADEDAVFVFPARRKSKTGHMGNLKKAWDRVMRRSGLKNVRQHDLRRTLGSWQARTGASLVLIGKSLNQKTPAATSVYARLDVDPVRESVGRATAAMFEHAGLKAPAQVIDFPAGKGRSGAPESQGSNNDPMRLWLDTEFNGRELISLALVDENGREWYEVLPCEHPTPWVKANVLPVLNKQATTPKRMVQSLAAWLGHYSAVHVMADWPDDFVHFCSALAPTPGTRLPTPPLSMELVQPPEKVASAIPHNALEDARALKHTHMRALAADGALHDRRSQ